MHNIPDEPAVGANHRSAFFERHFRAAAAILLFTMAGLQFASMQGETVANDEGYHLLSGYTFLRTGRLPLGSEHPPLAQLTPALPLLLLGLQLPGYLPDVVNLERAQEQQFLFANRYPAETILLVARSVDILLTMLIGLVLLTWTSRRFGAVPALAAEALFAFDPNFIAHGHYVINDVPLALTFLVAVLSWNRFMEDGRLSKAAICGVFTGIAISTKYSAGLLLPIYVLLYLVRWWQQSGTSGVWAWQCSTKHLIKSMLVVAAPAFLVMYAVFGFDTQPLLPEARMLHPMSISQKLSNNPDSLGGPGHWLLRHPAYMHASEILLQRTPIPLASFFRGLANHAQHQVTGQHGYFLGKSSPGGSRYFFPVVMAVKTPTGVFVLFLLAVAVSAAFLFRGGIRSAAGKLKTLNPEWYVLLVPPLSYFAACISSRINIGIQHALPVYLFLYIWIAAVLFSGRLKVSLQIRRAAAICIALVAAECLMAFPNYLGFFNAPSGGNRMGWRYVVDSNLDLGQDIKKLPAYLSSHGISNVCLGYFGAAPPAYFGITARDVPSSLEEARQSGCVVVMSITQRMFDRVQEQHYQWLDQFTPVDTVGSSYWIYDLNRGTRTKE